MELEYSRPATLAEACAALDRRPGQAAVLAGGTDLLANMRAGLARPELLVDVKRIAGLADIAWGPDGELTLGAALPLRRIYEELDVADRFAALAEGARAVGSLQIRCRGTIGGNLANGSPCMDTAPPLLVLGARLLIAGAGGARERPLDGFFLGVKRTDLRPGEILAAVIVPRPPDGAASAFEKVKRIAGHDLALVNAAALFDRAAGRLQAAIGACGATPLLLPPLENVASGAAGAAEAGARLAELALARTAPIDDLRASAEYRRDMTALLCRRLAARLVAPGSRRGA